MNSYYHAVISAKKHGGVPEDYQPLHDFIDSSKATMADARHRAILHSTFGIFVTEKVFGHTITNSEGKEIPTRLLAEEHIHDDLGFIPTPEHYLGEMPCKMWMSGTVKKTKITPSVPEEPSTEFENDAAMRYKKNLKDSIKSDRTRDTN